MNYLNYIAKKNSIDISITIIYFFTILFLFSIKFTIPNYFKYLIILTFLFLFFYVFFNGLLKKNIKINKKIFIIFLALIIIEYIFSGDNIYKYAASKETCKQILYLSFLCNYYNYIYIGYALAVSLILYNYKKINLDNIFIITGVIFSIFGLFYSIFFLIYSQIDINNFYILAEKFYFPPKMHRVFFHFSVTYLNSTRNYEIFIILISKIFIIKKIFNNQKFSKYKLIYYIIYVFLSIFIFYSFAKSIWLLDVILSIMLLYFFHKKYLKEILKLIIFKTLGIIIFFIIIFYTMNLSSILKYDEHNYRSNFFYYTAAKITSLFSATLTNKIYIKNTELWHFYVPYEKSIVFKDQDYNVEYFYNNKLDHIIAEQFSSNNERKKIYKEGFEAFIKKPLGYGVGKISIHNGNPESGILYVLLTYGLIGIALYSFLTFVILSELRSKIKSKININNNIFNYIFFIIFILSQIFNSYFEYIFFWFFLGFFLSKINTNKNIIIQNKTRNKL
jgi:hypothetical protein